MFENGERNHDEPKVLAQLGIELERALEREQAPAPAPVRRRRRRKTHTRTIAIALAGAAAVLIALSLGFGLDRGGNSVGVAEALADVARGIEVAPVPGRNQFEFTRSVSSYTSFIEDGIDYRGRPVNPFLFMRPKSQSSWLSPTRNGRAVWKAGKPNFPTPIDAKRGVRYFEALRYYLKAQRTARGRRQLREINRKIMRFNKSRGLLGFVFPEDDSRSYPAHIMASGGTFIGGEMLSRKQLAAFPRDPAAAYARIRKGVDRQAKRDADFVKTRPKRDQLAMAGNPDADEVMWRVLSGFDSFGQFPLPKDLRSTFVRALAHLPGVTTTGETKDRYGRPGVGFQWDHRGKRNVVVFDKETSVLLSASSAVASPHELAWPLLRHLSPGTVLESYQMIEQKTVDALPKKLPR